MLGLGYLNPAFKPVLLLLLLLLLFVVLNCNPGGKALATWGRLSIHKPCQMESALAARPTPPGGCAQPCHPHSHGPGPPHIPTASWEQGLSYTFPAMEHPLFEHIGVWELADSVKNHTLHCQYDFCLACSPKHCPLLCCWTEGPCAKRSLFLMGELTDKTSTPWTS